MPTAERPVLSERPDPAQFIRANLPILPVPDVPEIVLHSASPSSRLRLLVEVDAEPPPPYWAHRWAGGTVLARHILDHPESVVGQRVLDLGAGSGIVGIAAAKAGASKVWASEIDANGLVALGLNAVANGVEITAIDGDLTAGEPPDVELVLVGDLFYAPELAERVAAFLDRCLERGIAVLVGDPGRAPLPLSRLRAIAEYDVADFGDAPGAVKASRVFEFVPKGVG